MSGRGGGGAWLRPFRDLICTMPPYPGGDDDLDLICAGVLAAVRAGAVPNAPR